MNCAYGALLADGGTGIDWKFSSGSTETRSLARNVDGAAGNGQQDAGALILVAGDMKAETRAQ